MCVYARVCAVSLFLFASIWLKFTVQEISAIANQSKTLNRIMATILRNADAIFDKKYTTTIEES